VASNQGLPEKIRVSTGSAIVLGLINGRLDVAPTTVYMLTYHDGKCISNCGFCPQAKASTSRADMLARVTWPVFPTMNVIGKISLSNVKGDVRRVCIQALNYRNVFNDILHLTKAIRLQIDVPISVSCLPLSKVQLKKLTKEGVERISIALDAATKRLFDKVKGASTQGSYSWKQQKRALENAVEIFGRNKVYTHLIVGLGETEKQMTKTIQWCINSGVYPSLFAFTPIQGTALEDKPQPSIEEYRRVQLARYFIMRRETQFRNMRFDGKGRIIVFGVSKNQLEEAISHGHVFQTSGCPNCNRPYYNERPSGLMYNFPRQLLPDEISEIKEQLDA
jgi:biotin synthase-related radical SAM superfamily protein